MLISPMSLTTFGRHAYDSVCVLSVHVLYCMCSMSRKDFYSQAQSATSTVNILTPNFKNVCVCVCVCCGKQNKKNECKIEKKKPEGVLVCSRFVCVCVPEIILQPDLQGERANNNTLVRRE